MYILYSISHNYLGLGHIRYIPISIITDAIVVNVNHIVLISRKSDNLSKHEIMIIQNYIANHEFRVKNEAHFL